MSHSQTIMLFIVHKAKKLENILKELNTATFEITLAIYRTTKTYNWSYWASMTTWKQTKHEKKMEELLVHERWL